MDAPKIEQIIVPQGKTPLGYTPGVVIMPSDASVNEEKKEERRIYKENIRLKQIIKRLQKRSKELEDRLIKCPVTGLFNYEFFKNFLSHEIRDIVSKDSMQNPGLIIVSFDNMGKIMYSYGDAEVERVLKNSVYILDNIKGENDVMFRLQGALFTIYIADTNEEAILELAEQIRNIIASSEKFIEKITVSIGTITLNEIRSKDDYINEPDELMYDVGLMRVKNAKSMGMNIVCNSSNVEVHNSEQVKILLVDTDEINLNILKAFLMNLKYDVMIARDGSEAVKIVEENRIDLIVSEIMIPKMDGFLLREKLLSKSYTKKIPFIIISHLKDDDSVNRAGILGIEHYFQKPLMISELLGVVKNKIKVELN